MSAKRVLSIVALHFISLCLLIPTVPSAGQPGFDSLPNGVAAVAGCGFSLTNTDKQQRDYAPVPIDEDDRGHPAGTGSAAAVFGKDPVGGKTLAFNDNPSSLQPPIRAPPQIS